MLCVFPLASVECNVLFLQTVDIVSETESRYLEIVATGRKILKKALDKYGEDTRHLTGE